MSAPQYGPDQNGQWRTIIDGVVSEPRGAAQAMTEAKQAAYARGVEPVKVRTLMVAEPAATAPKSAPEATVSEPHPEVTRLLSLSIPDLEKALDAGEGFDHLEALQEAEKAGKKRKGALDVIDQAIADLNIEE